MDEFFQFFEKKLEKLFLALVGITKVKGTSVIEKETKTGAFPIPIGIHFWLIFQPKSRQKIDAKIDVEKT